MGTFGYFCFLKNGFVLKNFIASQNCRYCQFADKIGQGEYYGKSYIDLGIN